MGNHPMANKTETFTFRDFKFGCDSKGLETEVVAFRIPKATFLAKLSAKCESLMAEYRDITPENCPNQMTPFLHKLYAMGHPPLERLLDNPRLCGEFLNSFLGIETVKLIPNLERAQPSQARRVINDIQEACKDGHDVVLRCGVYRLTT